MITLPKSYLSWSQINLWNISKSKYIDQYIHNIEQYETKEMNFGKDFAKELEEKDNLTREIFLKHEIEGIKVVGVLDEMKDNSIIEYKTGKKKWTQERVDTHGQLALYTLLYFEEFQEMPKKVTLEWHETKEVDGEILKTGRVESFDYEVTGEKLEVMKKLIVRTAKEISDTFRAIEVESIDDNLIEEYRGLELTIRDAKKRQEEIKEALLPEIEKIKKYTNNEATLSLTQRKLYKYPDWFKDSEKQLKETKKEVEKNAKYELKNSLSIRIK